MATTSWRTTPRWLLAVLAVLLVAVVGLTAGALSQQQKNDKLMDGNRQLGDMLSEISAESEDFEQKLAEQTVTLEQAQTVLGDTEMATKDALNAAQAELVHKNAELAQKNKAFDRHSSRSAKALSETRRELGAMKTSLKQQAATLAKVSYMQASEKVTADEMSSQMGAMRAAVAQSEQRNASVVESAKKDRLALETLILSLREREATAVKDAALAQSDGGKDQLALETLISSLRVREAAAVNAATLAQAEVVRLSAATEQKSTLGSSVAGGAADSRVQQEKLESAGAQRATLEASLQASNTNVTRLQSQVQTLVASEKGLRATVDATKKDASVLAKALKSNQFQKGIADRALAERLRDLDAMRALVASYERSKGTVQAVLDTEQASTLQLRKDNGALVALITSLRRANDVQTQAMAKTQQATVGLGGSARVAPAHPMNGDGVLLAQVQRALESTQVTDVDVRDGGEDGGVLVQLPPRLAFGSASAGVASAEARFLAKLGQALGGLPKTSLVVEGHTDNVPLSAKTRERFGSNLEISAARAAQAAAHIARARGVDAARVSARGFGDVRPVSDNTTAQGRRLNRRVELRVSVLHE